MLSREINESENISNEAPAFRFDEKEGKCECWDKGWFTALVILSWILLLGIVGLSVYSWIEWNRSVNNIGGTKTEYEKRLEFLKNLVQEQVDLDLKIKIINLDIDTANEDLKKEKAENDKLKEQYTTLENEYNEQKKILQGKEEELKAKRAANAELKQKNENMSTKIRELTDSIETLRKQITHFEQETGALKIPTCLAVGVFGAGVVYTIYEYVVLLSVNSQLSPVDHYRMGFDTLSRAFEDYQLSGLHTKKFVKRDTCARSASKSEIAKCNGRSPTITTITTSDGFKLGAYFSKEWKEETGAYADQDAFTFSNNLGLRTHISDVHNAKISNSTILLQFGESDIVIALDGKSGTSVGKTYEIPSPYTKTTFYHNGTYNVAELKIDVPTIIQS